jgi:hypothetical protein
MGVYVDVEGYIDIAKASQYLSASDIALKDKTGGGALNSAFSMILYLVRRPIEVRFANDPTDETLNLTANYLYSLSLRYRAQAQEVVADGECIVPFIIVNPSTQSADEGDNVTFTVLAGGTTPLTYQWRKDGVNIGGATSSSLTLTAIDSGDEADYDVVVTNDCGNVTSSAATLTVSLALLAYYWYGDTDPFDDLDGGTDDLDYQDSVAIVHNAAISIPFPAGAATDKYEVVRVPIGESVKTTWYNTALNNGSIPDAIFRDAITIGSYRYYISRVAMSIDTSAPVIFS